MVESPRRTGLSGPTLVRLLARLTDIDVSEPKHSLSDRLSLWLGWTDAIALSTALNSSAAATACPQAAEAGSAEEQECARVRASLTKAITDNRGSARADGRGRGRVAAPAAPVHAPVDYAIYGQRYLSMQRAMETGIGNLRGQLRAALAARAPRMTPLAVVDAVMEQALGGRERSVLAAVPGLLESHFHRLRRAEEAAMAGARDGRDTVKTSPGAWLEVFRTDMRGVLLAELDIRFQPVEGLLAALRAS
jgi:hypothetical protein